jgi:D-arabinose 1-dehydrogenase-like Zn-dependent alcohol dehydrogenase
VKTPESVDLVTAAPLMCAGLSIYGGIKKAGVPPGGSIGIIGIGGLGHIGTQLAKAMVSAYIPEFECIRLMRLHGRDTK